MNKIALFGGVYSNHVALQALVDDCRRRGIDTIYCLGDLGAFGPNPDKVFPIIRDNAIEVVQGNYDHSIGNDLHDCACGYTDPADNYYAKLSYEYTFENTSAENKAWMKDLPGEIRLTMGPYRILLVHGSPRKTNEFLWESNTPDHFLEKLCDDYDTDVLCVTHTGLHWKRRLSGNRLVVNAGVLGRPANDGKTNVWYTVLELDRNNSLNSSFIPLEYDYKSLLEEMKEQNLPQPFIETIETGWWTTCLEVMPVKERLRGRY
jgi:predicted phosphodiesterase